MVVLYAPASSTLYGTVYQRGRSTLVGAPPAAVAAELERVWKDDVPEREMRSTICRNDCAIAAEDEFVAALALVEPVRQVPDVVPGAVVDPPGEGDFDLDGPGTPHPLRLSLACVQRRHRNDTSTIPPAGAAL
jgi:hypothetical protein